RHHARGRSEHHSVPNARAARPLPPWSGDWLLREGRMNRPIAVVGAPSSLGISPYADGEAMHLDRAPGVLLRRHLVYLLGAVDFGRRNRVARLGALDLGDVMPPPYRDYAKPNERGRNEREVLSYSRALAGRVVSATQSRRFAVVVGGDCSIVLGCLLAARKRA